MVVLVGSDDEKRVVLGDPVLGKPIEELAESTVVGRQLLHVTSLTGTVGAGAREVIVVRVGNIGVHDRHASFEHRRDIAEGLRRGRVEQIGEPGITVAVLNDVPIDVLDGA